MSQQLDMMFGVSPPRFPRARALDPSSSHEAAARVERSGTAKAQAERVLAAFRQFPMSTTAELAQKSGLNRTMVARRAPELAEANLLNRYQPTAETQVCEVSGIRCVRWRPA